MWEDNLQYVQTHNLQADRGVHTFWLGMNEYSDMVRFKGDYRINTRSLFELFSQRRLSLNFYQVLCSFKLRTEKGYC